MMYCIDIDGVICTKEVDYSKAKPYKDIIAAINKLYDSGHYIKIFTARGTVTKIDWRDITEKQFKRWGLKYHELIFGKPDADVYIDDKNMDVKGLKTCQNQ